jgi:type IV secretory pathway TraG/TraD family ATPase VirD4
MKKKFLLRLLGILIIGILIAFTISFYELLADEYNFALSKIPHSKVLEILISLDTYKAFLYYEDNLNQIGYIILGMCFIFMMFSGWSEVVELKSFTKSEKYGSHGTSRFQTPKEIKKNYYHNQLGWFLGATKRSYYNLGMKGAYHNSFELEGQVNQQVLAIGPPSTNKTTSLILPNMFHIPYVYRQNYHKLKEMPDIIVTDPKGEIFELTHDYYKETHEIWVLDFQYFKYGSQLNSLDYINTEEELMTIADGYVQSVEQSLGGNNADGHFWDEQEGQVLAALMGAVKQIYPPVKQSFTEVVKLLTSEEMRTLEDADNFFYDNGITGAPLQFWKNFRIIGESDRTKANILGGLATKLKLFAIDGVQRLTSKSTIDLSKLGNVKKKGEKPIVLYLLMRDEDKTFAPIINVTINTIINQMYNTARKYGSVLPCPVYFLMDEMANIGKLMKVIDTLSTMRGRRIYPLMIWQSLSQLKDKYPKEWENLLSMCDMTIYLGVNDKFTATYCSDDLGKTTIKTQGVSSKPKGFGVDDKTENFSYTQRPLMFPEEIRRMNVKKTLIVERGHNPIKINKIQYEHWKTKKRICNKVVREDILNEYSTEETTKLEIDDNITFGVESDQNVRKGIIEKTEEKYDKKEVAKEVKKEVGKTERKQKTTTKQTLKEKLMKQKEKENNIELDKEHEQTVNPYLR